jgi:CubicO group peptidase (beta-lactamase class C family)
MAEQWCGQLADDLFDELHPIADGNAVPGFVVSVRDSSGESSRCHGRASVHDLRPVTPATRFQVGSVSKVLCAHLVLDLIGAGALAAHDPIRRYVPEFAPQSLPGDREVTVDDLLTHRSGFDGDYHINTGFGVDALDLVVPAANSAARLAPPGCWYSYSNLGFALLGLVVQRVVGRPFEDVAAERVLGPLAMSTAGYHWQRPAGQDVAVGHRQRNGDIEAVDWSRPRCRMPNGGLVACAGDLTLMAASMARSHAPALLADAAGFADGAGPVSFLDVGATGTLCWHDGATPGFRSIVGWTNDVAVSMVCNGNHGIDLVRSARAWMQRVLVGGCAAISSGSMPIDVDEVVGTYRAPSIAGYHDVTPTKIVIDHSANEGASLRVLGAGGRYAMRWSGDRFAIHPSEHGVDTGMVLRRGERVVAIGWQGRVLPRVSDAAAPVGAG